MLGSSLLQRSNANPSRAPEFTPRIFGGIPVAYLFSFLCFVIKCLYVLNFVMWCPLLFLHKNDVRLSLLPVVCGRVHVVFVVGVMSCLRCMCLLSHGSVQHIVYCVFLRIVYSMMPVSLDYPFLIAPSVFSIVYLVCVLYDASFSGLSFFDCLLGIL